MKIALVSIYPARGKHHMEGGGVASYTHNLAHSLSVNNDIIVICDKNKVDDDSYAEDGIEVRRTFTKNTVFFIQIINAIKKEKPDIVHLQQELGLYGSILNALLLFTVLFFTKTKKTVTIHGVVSKNEITKKFVKDNNSKMPAWAVAIAFKIIYVPLISLSDYQIVHESKFKQILVKEYGADSDTVAVIPHGIEDVESMPTLSARNILNINSNVKVVLFVGYLTGYKGIDLLIEGFEAYLKKYDSESLLLIGAGKHPKLKNDNEYLVNSYNRLVKKAMKLINKNNYRWVGFISEKDLPVYYSAADTTVYPYTVSMSSSGPMALSIAYETPFIASNVFQGMFNSDDILFEQNPDSFSDKLDMILTKKKVSHEEIIFMRKDRQWSAVAKKHLLIYKKIIDESL